MKRTAKVIKIFSLFFGIWFWMFFSVYILQLRACACRKAGVGLRAQLHAGVSECVANVGLI